MLEKELKTAIEAARKAGEYLRSNRDDIIIKKEKEGTHNYATKQDLESDRIIIDTIRKAFPDDFILSEESTKEFVEHDRMWIIDPIDGTRNFANGLQYFSVSIAFYQNGESKVGVVYAPCYNDELFHAVKGEGAFLNESPLKMFNKDQAIGGSLVATGFHYFKGDELKKPVIDFEKTMNAAADVLRFGSAALDLCNIAAGRLGAYYEEGLKPWDIAAGKLILEEQGGRCTHYDGSKLDIFRKKGDVFYVDLLSTKNETIHSELKTILND